MFLMKEIDKRNDMRIVLLGAERQTGTFGTIMFINRLMMFITCPFIVFVACKEEEGLGAFIAL